MKAAVYLVRGRHHEDHLTAMASGLARHGVAVAYFSDKSAAGADFGVVWSWRVGLRMRLNCFDRPILVMERGYVDRFKWTSVGWNGLNGRAAFPEIDDPSRWNTYFAGHMRPWRSDAGYALLIGQVAADTALAGANIERWYRRTAAALKAAGWDVRFRQHPVEVKRRVAPISVTGAAAITGSLDDALSGAGLVVTFNSNTGVDAVLAGVPVHASDLGSMAWPVSSHDFSICRPDRERWAHELAWKQWTVQEIESGAAWECVRKAKPATAV